MARRARARGSSASTSFPTPKSGSAADTAARGRAKPLPSSDVLNECEPLLPWPSTEGEAARQATSGTKANMASAATASPAPIDHPLSTPSSRSRGGSEVRPRRERFPVATHHPFAAGGEGGAKAGARSGNAAARPRMTMQEKYDALVEEMKAAHGFKIRRWRRQMTGIATIRQYRDGTYARFVEAPYPRGPMSAAIFLHEVGHHAIGFDTYTPRCLEEYYAWKWSLDAMRVRGLNVTPAVEQRMAACLRYAVAKAARRGMKTLPDELRPYVPTKIRSKRTLPQWALDAMVPGADRVAG